MRRFNRNPWWIDAGLALLGFSFVAAVFVAISLIMEVMVEGALSSYAGHAVDAPFWACALLALFPPAWPIMIVAYLVSFVL